MCFFFSCQCRKILQISESISVQVGFPGDVFSWKTTGLAEVGEKGISKVGKDRGGKRPGGLRTGSQRQRESFILRAYIVGKMGVKKLYID